MVSKESKENKESSEDIENAEFIKINLTTIVILIIVLGLIVGIGIYMYLKPSSNNINVAKNDIKNINQNTVATEFDEETAITLLKDYLEIKATAMANPQSLLETYGFATNQQFLNYEKTSDDTFIKTDIMYENIRNNLQEYITKDLFVNEFKNIYKLSNGVTHVANINQAKETYNVVRYEREETKTKPVMRVWCTTIKDGNQSAEKNMKVEYTFTNKWIISDIK